MRRAKVTPEMSDTVGKRIANLRAQCGLSQKQLAGKLGVKQPQISAWESDEHKPSAPSLRSLARFLNTTIPFILHGVQTRTDTISITHRQETPVQSAIEQITNVLNEERERKSALFKVPNARQARDLYEILLQQPYNSETVHTIKAFALSSVYSPDIFQSLAEIVVSEGGSGNLPMLGICASVLAVGTTKGAREIAIVLDDLEQICLSMIEAENTGTVGVIEPLAFLLGVQKRPAALTANIKKMINDVDWRQEDASRIERYYGSLTGVATSLLAHMGDPRRKDILLANDTHRLLDVLKYVQENDSLSGLQPAIAERLKVCVAALRSHGQDELAKQVLSEAAKKKATKKAR